ncbi:MAG: exo-alpha-sialidase [Pirellulales bacterium]|nr:exo-alpha-sialidase [Pirellulales bacterium]
MNRVLIAILLVACCHLEIFAGNVLLEHYDVFVNHEVIDGLSYDTYRIPNIARTNDGTLIAVAEARLAGSGDPGATHIDLVYKRSFDGGRTWTAGHILDRHPDTILDGNGVPADRTSASNSVTFVDRSNNRLWNFNMRLPSDVPSASTQPGVDDMQTWSRFSDDQGATWSEPARITVSPYEDFYPNLGSSTQLASGRLIVPATQDNAVVNSQSFALYSDDHGMSWSAGSLIDAGTNEAQIVELSNGRLLMTARQNNGDRRILAFSDNQGASWQPSFAGFISTQVMEAVERYTQAGVGGETVHRLLHTIPAGGSAGTRTNLEIMIATNETESSGPTFGNHRRILHGWAAYSDLVNIDGNEVGVLWERGDTGGYQAITYTRLNRSFLEPEQIQLGLMAHEGFDYPAGSTLDSVREIPAGQDYMAGYAPVNFGSRTDLDLIFTLDMDISGGGTTTINPELAPNDQANGIFGQLFTTESEAGAVTSISVQRAPNGTAGGPVYLHLYGDTDLSDGIDTAAFLGASMTAESLNPTDHGFTTWTFSDGSVLLEPNTQYLFAFANTATPGNTTVARAALHVAPSSAGYALGGNGFNSAWHATATDLTNGPGASDAAIAASSLTFTGFRFPTDGNHAQLNKGGRLARGTGVGIDLDTKNTFFASLLISRAEDSGPDDAENESLDIRLMDASGGIGVQFGVDDSEAFFLNGPGGAVHTQADALHPTSTYFLVLKIQCQDSSDSSHFDQIYLKVFESGELIPDFEDEVHWTLVGNTGANDARVLDRIMIEGGANAIWSLDEIRIGGDFGATASGVAFTFSGDLNLDTKIDISDWLLFRIAFGKDTSTLGGTRQMISGDFDQSGQIGPEDFLEFVAFYDAANGEGSFARLSVPEPTSAWIAICAALMLVKKEYGVRN